MMTKKLIVEIVETHIHEEEKQKQVFGTLMFRYPEGCTYSTLWKVINEIKED